MLPSCFSGTPSEKDASSPGRVRRGVHLRFITPGRPVENCFIEGLHGMFRDECLNENWFLDLKDAKRKIEAWRVEDNTTRPPQLLGGSLRPRSSCPVWKSVNLQVVHSMGERSVVHRCPVSFTLKRFVTLFSDGAAGSPLCVSLRRLNCHVVLTH